MNKKAIEAGGGVFRRTEPDAPSFNHHNTQVLLIKPHASRPELGEPQFQLPKGSQHIINADGSVTDSKDIEDRPLEESQTLENLNLAALREVAEETGVFITPQNSDVGEGEIFQIISIRTKKSKPVFLLPILLKNPLETMNATSASHGLTPDSRPDSAETRWFYLVEVTENTDELIRADHVPAIISLYKRLAGELLTEGLTEEGR